MNNIKAALILIGGLIVSLSQMACTAGGTNSRPLAAAVYFPTTLSGTNVVPMSVGACGVNGYENEPCISITLCTPGTTTCQTIDNILVDTGSYGLKVFKSLITIPLTQISVTGGGSLASCTGYLDGSGHWGEVVRADVKLGGLSTQATVTAGIPIVTLNADYANPSGCSDEPDSTPAVAGFNGIIGVGSFVEDCGVRDSGLNDCVASATSLYWKCTGNNCQKTAVPLADQIANPVARLASPYNTGLVLKLPSVPLTGAGGAYGYMVLGVGTDANNTATGVTVFPVENDATFVTKYNATSNPSSGSSYDYAFIDSGTNFNGFPRLGGAPALCSGGSGFYCPATESTFYALMSASSGTVTKLVSFNVGNMITLASADPRSTVFNNIAFDTSDMGSTVADIPFDWGLPFFLGRSVYIGIKGTSPTINGSATAGPFWAF
ncbi:DUF3443 family protein [Bdellovibrio sp. HCB185ZH]|uniref:DUF3443 family protein n=1 Tax=Bdellovibrio sp. HCB185ZH TaxID=3394235 RepID=UPI0039A4F4D3